MTYYVKASRNDGGKEIFNFTSGAEAREWCSKIGYWNENYHRLLITTNNGNTLLANIPTWGAHNHES